MRPSNLLRPYYFYRPLQALRRLLLVLRTPASVEHVPLPFGVVVEVNPREVIGSALLHTRVWDIAVSEVLWRLLHPGDNAIDVGANLGYMTSLMATRVGARGRVYSFEPHPTVGARLARNIASLPAESAPVTFKPFALGASAGHAHLDAGPEFGRNEGLASVTTDASSPNAVRVEVHRLDAAVPDVDFRVAKVDVEGYELEVLRGASALLGSGRILHVVYECQHGGAGAAHDLLEGHDYTVFALGWERRGPRLGARNERITHPGETPDYVATLDPDALRATLAPRGWSILRGRPR